MNKLSFFIYFCKWYIIYYENTYKIILTTRFNSPYNYVYGEKTGGMRAQLQ